jgi:hypothetical protein
MRLERVRQVEVPDAAVLDAQGAGDERIAHRPVDGGRQHGAARAPDVGQEPLQHRQVRVARRPHCLMRSSCERHRAGDVELRVVALRAACR